MVEHPLQLHAVPSPAHFHLFSLLLLWFLKFVSQRDPVVELSQNLNSVLDFVVELFEELLEEVAVVADIFLRKFLLQSFVFSL